MKDGIRRDISIYWGNKLYYIELFEEEYDWQLNIENGEKIFNNMISFF